MAVRHIADADFGKRGVEDVRAVAAGIHPAVDDRLRRRVALGDVLARRAVAQAETANHIERRAVGGAVVREIAAVVHILRLVPRHARQFPVGRQRGQAVLRAVGVDQFDDLRLERKRRRVVQRDVDLLPGVNQVGVCKLRVGGDQLVQPDLVLDGDFPQAVALDHRIDVGVGRRGDGGQADGQTERRQRGKRLFYRLFHAFSFLCFFCVAFFRPAASMRPLLACLANGVFMRFD